MRLLASLAVVLAFAVSAGFAADAAAKYGPGGSGITSASRLNFDAVMSCLFELGDLNHNRALELIELEIVLDKYLTKAEQIIDGLSPRAVIAACDTDRNHAVSWLEATETPRCLTRAQIEGIAKWVCSRARHGDFSFDEYLATADALRMGILSGHGMRTFASEFARIVADQSIARQAFLARQAGTPRVTDTVQSLLDSVTQPASLVALIWAVPILGLALLVACI